MSNKNQGGDKPPNYDYTGASRQKMMRQRKSRAYIIAKAIAQRLGYMSDASDMTGLDKFFDEFIVDGHEIDWFETMTELLNEAK